VFISPAKAFTPLSLGYLKFCHFLNKGTDIDLVFFADLVDMDDRAVDLIRTDGYFVYLVVNFPGQALKVIALPYYIPPKYYVKLTVF
jgi:hypothetical protein